MAVVTGTPRTLRRINDRAALELLLTHGPLSRARLVELTGLSKPTASQLLARLARDGLVVEQGKTSGARGPNAQLYALNEKAAHVVAVDVAEDHVSAVVANLAGRVVAQSSSDVDIAHETDPVPGVKRIVTDTVRRARLGMRDMHHVTLGVPAVYDETADTLLFAGDIPGWTQPGALQRLRTALRVRVVIDNDVNLAAVAERRHGAGRGSDGFALLWVGLGLGLAIDIGGALYRGATGGAGEIGYMPVAATGRRTPAIGFHEMVGPTAVLDLAARHRLPGEDAAAAVAAGVAAGRKGRSFLDELARRLATGLAPIVAVLDPPLVVLAGPTCVAGGDLLVELASHHLRDSSPFRTPLTLTGVPDNPVLSGAVTTAAERARVDLFGDTSVFAAATGRAVGLA